MAYFHFQECAADPNYRATMQTEGMIADLVRNLLSDSPKLRMLCARAIFRLAEEGETRDLVRYNGGLDPLVEMLNNKENQNDMVSTRKSKYFAEYLDQILVLVREKALIRSQYFHCQELMAAVTGAIWKCATDSFENVERFEELELMKTLVGILKVIL